MHRGRRLRRTAAMRAMVAETHLSAAQLVAPLFVIEGTSARVPISSMPGHYRLTADLAAREAADLSSLGVGAVILFGIPSDKDPQGTGAWDDQGPRAGDPPDKGPRRTSWCGPMCACVNTPITGTAAC